MYGILKERKKNLVALNGGASRQRIDEGNPWAGRGEGEMEKERVAAIGGIGFLYVVKG
jgi:hypothetical protein